MVSDAEQDGLLARPALAVACEDNDRFGVGIDEPRFADAVAGINSKLLGAVEATCAPREDFDDEVWGAGDVVVDDSEVFGRDKPHIRLKDTPIRQTAVHRRQNARAVDFIGKARYCLHDRQHDLLVSPEW